MKPTITTLIIVLIVFVGWWFYPHERSLDSNQQESFLQELDQSTFSNSSFLAPNKRNVPEGWLEYKSTQVNFSLFYPQELVANERKEGDNASTITFQNIKKGLGFQIFVLPYAEPQISEERFKKDVPSGIRIDLENIKVDNVEAVAFYSRDAFLGETREIWFIHEGFLYEVTTLRALDQWLSEIIESWRFI